MRPRTLCGRASKSGSSCRLPLAAWLGGEDSATRAAILVGQMMGLSIMFNVLRPDALKANESDQLSTALERMTRP